MISTVQNTISVIEISGVGPIQQFKIPLCQDGGIVVLKGDNGFGKSYALRAVQSRLGAKVRLEANDSLGKGEILGFGGRTTVAKQIRQSKPSADDFAIVHIEDRFDLSKIVDPGLKDSESNDLARLKALVQLGGMEVPDERFLSLTDGLDVDLEESLLEADLVSRVAAVKRVLQARARDYEKQGGAERQRQAVAESHLTGVDLSQPAPDMAALSRQHDALVAERSALKSQIEAAARDQSTRFKAQAMVEAECKRYSGPAPQEAAKVVAQARQAVEAAKEALRTAEFQFQNAVRVQEAAAVHAERLDEAQSILSQPVIAAPSVETLEAAEQAVQNSHARTAAALKATEARQHAMLAAEHRREAEANEALAARLRKACGDVEGLLAEAMNFPGLRWLEGRLLCTGADGKEELFDRLSDGLRWHLAIRVGAKAVSRETGDGTNLLILPQAAWQDLSPSRRDMVFDLCITEKVNMLTAQCSDGPLRAVRYGEPDTWELEHALAV